MKTRNRVSRNERDEVEGLEAPLTAADYEDREGYDPAFLGSPRVPLPKVTNDDLLKFRLDGREKTELKYTHFSVLMSRRRKVPIVSAVNIDGSRSKRGLARTGWKPDPRIPEEKQLTTDVYGNSPRFSRGHMTRREDPNWGPKAEAQQGNRDSMHYTNAAPQMQPFNAPVWLSLEDYALKNARKDKMRISVFTGPFLRRTDPTRYGVKIPAEFWKVIAFIHDETRKLCCTGYKVSQIEYLRPEEFVFGAFKEYQIPVRSIEKAAKLDFGSIADRDPLAGEEAAPIPLSELAEIRFV